MKGRPSKAKKLIKNVVLLVLLAIALYNSVYFRPLDEVVRSQSDLSFDPALAVAEFMNEGMGQIQVTNASDLISRLESDLDLTLEEQGKKLGISKNFYFMVEDDARVISVLDEAVLVGLGDGSGREIRIATDFIFGNAIREASGMFDIGDYQNTMDFNNISIELNNRVRDEIIPPFLKSIKEGDQIYFKGAIKINQKEPALDELRVVPLVLKIN
ncbi:putative lipoprotein DUF2291 [Flavobacteriaceae bacterium MAR_2009_75]|nr:putative lipoprotein DUF2291 [Flavobacteriaceae bacterium MAR_2009_75]